MKNRMGKAIREKRIALGYTQQELGIKVGRTASQIGQIERGMTMPSVEVLTGIVHVLSLDANLMFHDSETSDELKDAMAMLRQISPERQQFILEIIQMAYKEISQTEGEHE